MASLEAAFASFTDLATKLDDSVRSGQADVEEASSSILKVKEDVQTSVQQWATKLSKRSSKMVQELLDNQKEHLSMVSADR